MKLLIFTPIHLFGEALTASLNEFEEIEVVATCHLVDRVADRALELAPDLLLFDVTGGQALAEARGVARACPTIRMIALALPEVPPARMPGSPPTCRAMRRSTSCAV